MFAQKAASVLLRQLPLRSFASGPASGQLNLIKELRGRTGAPMADVKAALVTCNWDAEAAFEDLRKRGLASAAKKASRTAAEGLIGVRVQGSQAVLVEVNSETDFVARSQIFQDLVRSVADAALQGPANAPAGRVHVELPKETLQDWPASSGSAESVKERVMAVAAEVRENISLRRATRLSLPAGEGVLGSYTHGGPTPGLGRIGGVVALGGGASASATPAQQQLAHQLAMHVVAMKPQFLDGAAVPRELMEEQRAALADKQKDSPKPPAVVAKIVDGQLQKWLSEVCLVNQTFMIDDSMTVKEAVAKAQQGAALPLRILDFLRMEAGEGVHKEVKNFAEEVASQLKK